MKQSQDFQVKLILKFLQNILGKEQSDKQKERVMNVMDRYKASRLRADIKGLSQAQSKMFILLEDGFRFYKQSFMEMLRSDPKYRAVGDTAGFDINDFLFNTQSNINIPRDSLTIESLVAKYTYNILKLKKTYDFWPKELTSEWNNRAKEKMKKMELKRQESSKRKEEEPKVENQRWSVARFDVTQPQKVQNYSESEDFESYDPKPKPAQIYKAPPPQRQPERELERRVIPEKPQPRGRIQQRQETRGDSLKDLRSKMMEKYLQNRKDIHIQKGKMKEMAEFLTSRLDHFMKKTLEKILDIAALKNKKNSKFGQLAYFSAASERVTPQSSLYYSASSKIYSMQYKHKLEIYTTLRSKQLKKEDELRNALQANTSETQKKVDKKIENYILKTRPKEVEPIQVFKQDKDARVAPTNTLYVYGEHLLYYLQTHRYLRNSLLLFNGYHY